MSTTVYQYFHGEVLLYVGITSRGHRRAEEHCSSKAWWHQVTHATFTHFDERWRAEEAERALIESLSPVYNVVHNVNPRALRSTTPPTPTRRQTSVNSGFLVGEPIGNSVDFDLSERLTPDALDRSLSERGKKLRLGHLKYTGHDRNRNRLTVFFSGPISGSVGMRYQAIRVNGMIVSEAKIAGFTTLAVMPGAA